MLMNEIQEILKNGNLVSRCKYMCPIIWKDREENRKGISWTRFNSPGLPIHIGQLYTRHYVAIATSYGDVVLAGTNRNTDATSPELIATAMQCLKITAPPRLHSTSEHCSVI